MSDIQPTPESEKPMKITEDKHAHLIEVTELALLKIKVQGSSLFGKSVNTRTDELLSRIYKILDIEVEAITKGEQQ